MNFVSSGLGSPVRLTVSLIAAACAAHFTFLEFWLHYELGTFYCYRLDDIFRIQNALIWAKHPSLLPYGDWLPLPSYLLGAILKFLPDPWMVPLHWHNFLAAAILAILGMITLEMFPDRPILALVPIAIAPQIPYFEQLALSAGAEVDLWFFILLSAWFWFRYLRSNRIGYAWLNAVCLFLASMTRYEAWLFVFAFLPIQIFTFSKRGSLKKTFHLPLLAIAYIFFYICWQEMAVPSSAGFIPLSWRGLRFYFRGECADVIRSFMEPLSHWFKYSPILAVMEFLGVLYAVVKKPELRWYMLWSSLTIFFFCCEAAIVGIPTETGRLVVIFHLLQVPLICCFLNLRIPQKVFIWAWLIALAASMFLLQGGMPRLKESHMVTQTVDSFIIAKAIREMEMKFDVHPNMLIERQLGPGVLIHDDSPFIFALFGRLVHDREKKHNLEQLTLNTENNPSIFSLKRDELGRYLRQNKINWIVVCSKAGLDAAKHLAIPVATSGSRTLLAYQYPPEIIEHSRRRIQEIARSLR